MSMIAKTFEQWAVEHNIYIRSDNTISECMHYINGFAADMQRERSDEFVAAIMLAASRYPAFTDHFRLHDEDQQTPKTGHSARVDLSGPFAELLEYVNSTTEEQKTRVTITAEGTYNSDGSLTKNTQQQSIVLTDEEYDNFIDTCSAALPPNQALKAAFKETKKRGFTIDTIGIGEGQS